MTFAATTPTASATVRARSRVSEGLLLAGAAAGPLVVVSSITQMLTREGFDITRHPMSQLATGAARCGERTRPAGADHRLS